MSYSVKYNDIELNQYLNVLTGFTPYIGADWQPSVVDYSGHVSGSEFQYLRHGVKTIPMPFYLRNDLGNKVDDLQRILNVSEPKKLIFGNQRDRYYLAIPEGTMDFEQICAAGTGTINWIIPDGVAHAITEKTFDASEQDGVLSVVIENGGSGDTPVEYDITFRHDSGYIGVVSQYGAMQFGMPQEVDGTDYQGNDTLISGLQDFLDAPDDHGTNYMHPNHVMTGTLGYASNSGGIVLESMGTGESGKWCGGMRTINIPADSSGAVDARNFYCYMNWWFQAGKNGQSGEQSIAFLTADNKVICGYSLYKSDMVGNSAGLEFWLNGRAINTKTFQASSNQNENPFDGPRGNQDIRKEGSNVTFYFGGTYTTVSDPDVENMECAKIQIAFTQYYGRNLDPDDQYITRNCLRNLIFQKMNVDKWQDVPNRYSNGDKIQIVGEERKIYKNGMNVTGDEVKGTDYFQVPPGATLVEFYFSDFCIPLPTVTAKIREVYL